MGRKPYIMSTETKLMADENGQLTLTVYSDTARRRHNVQNTQKLTVHEIWGTIGKF